MDAWCARRALTRGGIMTLDQCWAVSRAWYAGRLEPGWRGRSAQAAQEIFQAAGLTGAFWAMR